MWLPIVATNIEPNSEGTIQKKFLREYAYPDTKRR